MKILTLLSENTGAILFVGLILALIFLYIYLTGYLDLQKELHAARRDAIDANLKLAELKKTSAFHYERAARFASRSERLENQLVAIYGLAQHAHQDHIADLAFHSLPEETQKQLV